MRRAKIILLSVVFFLSIFFIADTKSDKEIHIATANTMVRSVDERRPTLPRIPFPSLTITSSTTTSTTTTTTTTAPPRSTTTAPPQSPRMRKIYEVYHSFVPQHWQNRITPRFRVVEGGTSRAYENMQIDISEYHADSSREYLAVIITHEYGHLIAFRYGSGEYYGAAPKGWPPRTNRPEEHWADCVQAAFMGYSDPVRGLPPCEGEQLSWAKNYLSR